MASVWFKDSFQFRKFELKLDVPHDVFSTLQIDEGTLALLDHLPEKSPQTVLDMGCGYGALGLPVAKLYPKAIVHLLDRDLLAVEWSQKNAVSNQIQNAKIYGSLGFRDLDSAVKKFDWILCNVPARIGDSFIEDLFLSGQNLLASEGEIRVVVIRDLGPVIEKVAQKNQLAIRQIFHAGKHIVYALDKSSSSSKDLSSPKPEQLYRRDQVRISNIDFERPFDISGDSIRVEKALPILIDALPKKDPGDVLCLRSSYGILPIVACKRWPTSKIKTFDRDLLATTFARENGARLQISPNQLEISECVDLRSFCEKAAAKFDLVLGEVSPSVGRLVVEEELGLIAKNLKPGGQALFLCGDRLSKEILLPYAKKMKMSLSPLIARDSMVVLRLS